MEISKKYGRIEEKMGKKILQKLKFKNNFYEKILQC